MFIIHVNHKVSLDIVDQHLTAHIDYLKQQYSLGNFIASGRQVSRTGGIILSNMENKKALDRVLEQDPFKQNNLVNYEVSEFVPSMICKKLEFLRSN